MASERVTASLAAACFLSGMLLFGPIACSSSDKSGSMADGKSMEMDSAGAAKGTNNEKPMTAGTGPGAQASGGAERLLDDARQEVEVRRRTAQHYLEQGDRRFEEADYGRAERMYRLALENDPTLDAAREKLQQSLMALGRRDGEIRGIVEELGQQIRVGKQQQLAETRRLVQTGKEALAAGRVREALRDLGRAREQLIAFDFAEDVTQLRNEATALYDQARDQRLVLEEEDRLRREQAAIDQAREETRLADERLDKKKDSILERAEESMARREYEAAVQLYDEALAIDSANSHARRQRQKAADRALALREVRLIERNREETRKTFENLSESAVPYDQPFVFSDDENFWRNQVRRREDDLRAVSLDETFEVQQIRNVLETQTVSFDFSGETTLGDAIAFLREYTGLNITVDPEIDTVERKVKLRLSDTKLREALDLLLSNVGLAYAFQENTLYITEKDKAFGNLIFDVYNVTDVLNKIKNFPGPSIRVKSPDDVDDSGGANPFGGFSDSESDEETQLDPEGLVDLIKKSTGGDELWDASNSTIEPHNASILITATRELHLATKEFLDDFRKGTDLFVIVEARFIDIVDDFLEDIGIDTRNLGLPPGSGFGTPYGSLNSSRSGGLDQGFQNLGNPTNPSLIMGLDRVAGRVQHILDGFVGGVTGTRLTSALRGLTLQATWLDPFQINAIVRASVEESQSRIVTAPRVTASNGQRVYVSVITQRAYIQDYELVSGGTGLVVQEVADPVIGTFQDGVILDVQPVISADRKYITLDVRPTIASLVNGVISTVEISLGSITQAAQQVEIDLPEISLQQAFTSVTVPDGGTVLLGGFRALDEQKYESYIPVLGKIPVIKNLFRRQAYLRERRSLYILLTASVVDLREEERRLYN
ncbi:MAG: hypothetical protein AB7O52_16010 [Planctomycetota bacterium]